MESNALVVVSYGCRISGVDDNLHDGFLGHRKIDRLFV
jgi:hypothetical protein